MRTNIFRFFAVALCLMTAMSCLEDDSRTIMLASGVRSTNIPSDSDAEPNPYVSSNNTSIPNFQHSVEIDGGYTVIRIDMTGVQTPDGDYIRLVGTGGANGEAQNVWIEIDDQPKGIIVQNNADNPGNVAVQNDFVFLVDNSGSMSEEADAIARDIVQWAQKLSAKLDVRFGCVGYGYYVGSQYWSLTDNYGIAGALNMTTYEQLSTYLNGRGKSGTACTVGYEGEGASQLKSAAQTAFYNRAGGECGAQALLFADTYFNFRKNANRIYVNFTDDANYPAGNKNISVEIVNSTKWDSSRGTVHTVFSGNRSNVYNVVSSGLGESPWLMSEYTGGSIIDVPSNFSGVNLDILPVTAAMQNSYVIRFTNVEQLMDGCYHTIEVTIKSADGRVRATKRFSIKFDEM